MQQLIIGPIILVYAVEVPILVDNQYAEPSAGRRW